ncbi:MAG TPA: ABC transporter permease [Ktedonobacterales bacterium]
MTTLPATTTPADHRASPRSLRAYLTATHYALSELARNRFAMGLLLIFVPLWYFLLGALIDNTTVAFKYAATGALLQVDGHNLTLLTAGLNTITLIVGFLLFAQTRASAAFDRRLVLCGYRQVTLMLAKLTGMLVASALIALYATLTLLFFWRPPSLPLIWLGFFGAALIYGALGLFIGAVVTSEIAGFFLVIMVSLFDTFFQNPVDNPLANNSSLRYFPSYGPTQISVGGGFTHSVTGYGLGSAAAWFIALALLGLVCFWLRTRAWNAGGRSHAVVAEMST